MWKKILIKERMRTWLTAVLAVVFVTQAAAPVYAKDRDDSYHFETGTTTAIGDTTIEVYENGKIKITMTAKTATNSWRWRTVGYYITKKPLAVDADRITGPAGKSARDGQVIWLDHKKCKVADCPYHGKCDGDRTDKSNDGTTTTTITLSKACIDAHCRASGIELASGGETVYLQGVIAFYYGNEYRSGDYYSIDQTRAANRAKGGGRDWSFFPKSSGEGWVKRYNIPIFAQPEPVGVAVNYFRKNTKAQKAAGETTTWKSVKTIESSDSRWTSKTASQDNIANGNGLGFETADYCAGDKLHHTTSSAPRTLNKVLGGTDYDGFYAYRFSWSKKSDKVGKTSGSRKQYGSNCFTGNILDTEGKVTDDYKEWLKDARLQKFTCQPEDVGLILNVYYRKATIPKEEKETDNNMTPAAEATIQSDPRGADTTLDVETYDSTEGIPSSEPQYVNVYAKDYLYTVGYETKTESKTYNYHQGCH